jgi:hypothetical protein
MKTGKLHRCFWPGCGAHVSISRLGCAPHWFALPESIRTRIWASYRPGQEEDGELSAGYADALEDALRFARGESKDAAGQLTFEW